MKILFDTNVILDASLRRLPFVEQAEQLMALVEKSRLHGCLCATTLTTIDYLLKRSMDRKRARKQIHTLVALFEVAPVNRAVIEAALENNMTDFEDAVLAESARRAGADGIVTRNERDFRRCPLRVYASTELLNILSTL